VERQRQGIRRVRHHAAGTAARLPRCAKGKLLCLANKRDRLMSPDCQTDYHMMKERARLPLCAEGKAFCD